MNLKSLNESIPEFDIASAQRAKQRWDNVAKPIGSLGSFEDIIIKIAGLTHNDTVDISKRIAVIMCADNGVIEEGVSQAGSEITTLVANNIARQISSVCKLAYPIHMDTVAVDVGMKTPATEQGVIDACVRRSTRNIAHGPAMTQEETEQAIFAGINIVKDLADKGYSMIAAGEMGIANTTTSAACASVLLDYSVEEITGRGAGLTDEAFSHKKEIIEQAIKVNSPDKNDAFDVLSKLGGYDLAGMVGLFIGGALYQTPVIIDGFPSALSAYIAQSIAPKSHQAMIASHMSKEPAAARVMEKLNLSPIIDAGLRLGEGTGALCMVPLLDMTISLYDGKTFNEIGMNNYRSDLW